MFDCEEQIIVFVYFNKFVTFHLSNSELAIPYRTVGLQKIPNNIKKSISLDQFKRFHREYIWEKLDKGNYIQNNIFFSFLFFLYNRMFILNLFVCLLGLRKRRKFTKSISPLKVLMPNLTRYLCLNNLHNKNK